MNVAMSVVYQYCALEASEVLKLRMSLLRPESAETKEGTVATRVATVACQWRTMEDEGGRSMDGVCATFTLAREQASAIRFWPSLIQINARHSVLAI